VSVEKMAAQLEVRVTQLSMDLARMTHKCLCYEQNLEHMLHCENLDHVKDKVYSLKILAGQAFHCCEANDPKRTPEEVFQIDGITNREGEDVRRVIYDVNALDLIPPACRMPGDTLIQCMYPDLLLYVMKELSVEKASGADWRMLGLRAGVHQTLIDDWYAMALCNPAGRVLEAWSKLCPATVRLLHRHLMSPPMRCTVICRRISDFYDVC